MIVRRGRIKLLDTPPVIGQKPSIDILFASLAEEYHSQACGFVMTGMGTDGVSGALSIKTKGGFIVAQDEASCVVFGMPQAVIKAGLADKVMSTKKIVDW